MDNTLQIISKSEALEALNRSEVDIQIATAKQYPRVVADCVNQIVALATIDEQTAEECFYSLRRNEGKDTTVIEGPSVRLAEIIATSWGNLRVQSQIIGNDGKFLTARGICHDLQTNVAVSSEVQRRIRTKEGKLYSDDMQMVTGNAAAAIAFRNAVFKVVPKAVISKALDAIKEKAKGNAEDLEVNRQKMLSYYAKLGVTKEMILFYLGVESVDDINGDGMNELRGVKNSIKEGMTTVKEAFIDPYQKNQATQEATKHATGAHPGL